MTSLIVAAGLTVDYTTPGTAVFDPVSLGLDSTLNFIGTGVNVILSDVTAIALSTINVSSNAVLEITGLSAGILNTFNIATAGTLIIATSLSSSTPINFTSTNGTLVLQGSGISLLSPVSGFTSGSGNEIKTSGVISSYSFIPDVLSPATLGTLVIVNSDGTSHSVVLIGSFNAGSFQINLDGSIGIACFARGTRILTSCGYVEVEKLSQGDQLATYDGRIVPIKWVGRRTYRAAPGKQLAREITPVCIRAGALGKERPLRDLIVSPEHSMFLDGVLVPAGKLVDGNKIFLSADVHSIDYFHLELDKHEIIVAEGIPTESWLDTGNRHMFDNGGTLAQLHPDFRSKNALEAWLDRGCARLVDSGPALEMIRQALGLQEAHSMLLDRVGSSSTKIPAGNGFVRLVSKVGSAAGDQRQLGAALTSVQVDELTLQLDAPELSNGFHDVESGHRWTNGFGWLNLGQSRNERILTVTVAALSQAIPAIAA